ncbi:MAG: CocE/NonD family hydrolase [Acidobacteria bacterium]|nr:CocE/NonD family hydrolase [Acidobacteriota bacterium]
MVFQLKSRHLLAALFLLAAARSGAQTFTTTVPAPDGTPLATDVYLPLLGSSWPVILIRTPYGKDGMHDTCVAANILGYACVAQDTRGRFDSGGEDTVFRDDGPDGRAALEWLAGQEFCNGKVGTFGGSALGITQYMMAPGAPGILKCQVPVFATADLYHVAMFQGGVLRHSLVYNWLEGQGSLGYLPVILDHRWWDAWWAEATPLLHPQEVRVPTLHVAGWYDIFLQGNLEAFTAWQELGGEGARGRQNLVVGPWTHGYDPGGTTAGQLSYPESSQLDPVVLTLDYLEHWLKGKDNGVAGWPPVRIYLMGAVGEAGAPGNVWIDLDRWPPALPRRQLFLTAAGGLAWTPPDPGQVDLVADPADPVPTLGGANLFPNLEVDGRPMGSGPWDQRSVEDRPDVLSFTTPVLASPVTVAGRLWAHLWVLPDTPDLDLSVRLTDVYPDGRSMLVIDGIARARFRCGEDRECLLTPGVAARIDVDLWSTAIVFNAGHRIRVDIAGSNWPRFEVNPNDGGSLDEPPGSGVVAHPRILVGPVHPSSLDLPVLPTSRSPRRPAARAVPTGFRR